MVGSEETHSHAHVVEFNLPFYLNIDKSLLPRYSMMKKLSSRTPTGNEKHSLKPQPLNKELLLI